ncbi:glycosyltransferase [Candidatus Berkelbacteria bacterium]|nr:glycosyltransferase [Candidatus Berkelbacteria bacterium]
MTARPLKVALVHEFLTQYGGAERVLEAFMALFPDALVYTLVYDEIRVGTIFPKERIRTSPLQLLPFKRHYKWYLPALAWAVEQLEIPQDVDLVLTDASAYAKGVRVPAHIPHLCYLHTPTRYLWSVRDEYVESAPIPALIRPFVGPVLDALKRWDYLAAQRPDRLIANSKNTAIQAKRYYDREPQAVIFPFVNTKRFVPVAQAEVGDYFLMLVRIEPYKKVDLVAEVFAELGWPLKVAGGGSKLAEFRERFAKDPNIEFLGRVSDEALPGLYAHCRAFIFPQEEDAGMTPLEAMASGRPVLAYGQGGALESVKPGVTGEFFTEQTPVALKAALTGHDWMRYTSAEIRRHAERFDLGHFTGRIEQEIETLLDEFHQRE